MQGHLNNVIARLYYLYSAKQKNVQNKQIKCSVKRHDFYIAVSHWLECNNK